MGIIAKPNEFVDATPAEASEVNDNFDTIYNEFNGSISAANLATNAVTTAKITDSNVTTAKIADSNVTTAKIADDAVTPAKWTNPYCFRAWASTTTTLTDAAFTKILFATESFDYNNNFAGSTYTVPIAGVYHFDAGFCFDTSIATGVIGGIWLYKNGTQVTRGNHSTAVTNGGYTVSADLLLAANDTIEVYGYQDSAGNEATDDQETSTYFSGHLVHAI